MALSERLHLYRQVEAVRGRPLICYVTSSRQGSNGQIASDTVPELLLQLQALPPEASELDFLLVSNGGDPTVAWRVVSLIRERTKKFSVLVPQAAYSAATLIALGADEIVMHPHGNLGPTDPQIHSPRKGQKDSAADSVPFGSEDLAAFLRFAREEVGLGDQAEMLAVFQRFCDDVGPVGIGVAARSAQLTVNMGEKLLQLHMPGETNKPKARAISEKLTRDFFHHGYPVSRTEAKEIGLKIAASDQALEALMWRIWEDISIELRLREPFNPLGLLRADAACDALFAPVPQVQLPGNLPAAVAQQALNQALQQVGVVQVPPTPFENVHALMESARANSRFVSRGLVFGSRLPDQQFRVSTVTERQSWITVEGDVGATAAGTRARIRASTGSRRRART
jgi:hypothetical protein